MLPLKLVRPLTGREQKFLEEAEAGSFGYGIENDGTPFALGAEKTGNLFTVPYIEEPDSYSGGSVYWPEPENE